MLQRLLTREVFGAEKRNGERIYIHSTLNMEIQGEGRVKKKIARWAFEPALRGGFNYTPLELRLGHCTSNDSGRIHGVI